MRFYQTSIIALFTCLSVLPVNAQNKVSTKDINSVYTAVPFLTIAPDSRSAAMGDVGVATSPDVNSLHWNSAKYAFIESGQCIALSYSPWLKGLVHDMKLLYLTGYKRIDDFQVIAASLRYFHLGNIIFTNAYGDKMDERSPNEFALDAAYSRKFSDNISAALAFRYVRSDISAGMSNSTMPAKAGNSFAADISMYYHSELEIFDKSGNWAFGTNISNIGNKMSYANEQQKTFLPINLRIGGSMGLNLDYYNKITFAVDFNKLLVPTPPKFDENGIMFGKQRDVPVVKGIFQSFSDAPAGFEEEIHEISYGLGLEYMYRETFAIRTGYFHEHPTKGNRRYFTMGFGFNVNMIGIDFSYLIATNGRNNPMNNTLRLTFVINLGTQTQKTQNKV